MDINHLKSFLAVADTGSFTKAAEGLFSTQPTLSRHINMLEGELGVKLIDRDRHHVALTEAGEILFKDGKAWIAEMIAIERKVSKYSESNIQQLDIICSPMYSQILRKVYFKFCQKYPDISCCIRQVESGQEFAVVERGDADIGVLFYPTLQEQKAQFNFAKISEEKMCLVAGVDSAIAQRPVLSLEDFKDETLLIAKYPMNPWLKGVHASVEKYFGRVIYVENLEIVTLNLSNNQGVSIWPEIVVEDTQSYSRVLNVPGFKASTTLWAVWSKENPNKNIKAFVDMFMNK